MAGEVRATRRATILAARHGGLAAAGLMLAATSGRAFAEAADADLDLVARLIGRRPVESKRVRLAMPARFPNGYTVPLTLDIDSPMTPSDFVRQVQVFAPQNPIVLVARFRFSPLSGRAHLSTRIRLAKPQTVLAVAELGDGAVLAARTWVTVASNGCA